jgi:Transposase domain (DUF772)
MELDFVRLEVAKFYGTKGNVAEDPVVIIKMMLLRFLDNMRSERELLRIIPERLDYMWFLGYGLDDTVPNHSALSKARNQRIGGNKLVPALERTSSDKQYQYFLKLRTPLPFVTLAEAFTARLHIQILIQ